MKLTRVDISNFRSINELKFTFDHSCQALIGINESGKSNVLRALHLLDPDVAINASDLRIERHDEPRVESGHVRFVFDLDAAEVEEVFNGMLPYFGTELIDQPLVISGSSSWTLRTFCNNAAQGVYVVSLPDGKRSFTAWGRPTGEKLAPGWYRNKVAQSVSIPMANNTTVVVAAEGFIRVEAGISFSEETTFEPATAAHVSSIHRQLVAKVISSKLPKCIFWKYADQYLLPSSIDVANFCAAPDTCIPLKSMFELAGYDAKTLGATLTQAQSQGHHRYVQILEKTSKKASEHIQQAWKDYKTVHIKLESHGPTLSPVIVDDVVPLDMANRSDGFKRFVSFLLQVSAKVRTKELKDTLILIDEPEIALHPSGARNLMRELIEIGNTNTVVYSTHSIFMIDKNEIGRHVVVEKKKEVTTTWRAEKSRIQDEEVLYSAIGYSIFETLKAKNVIFEGWRDKELFRIVSEAMGKSDGTVKLAIAEIGMTFADGVKDVKNVAHFLQLASRPCLILSDADKPALQYQKAYQNPGAWGKWKTLKEVLPGTSVVTGEDLVSRSAVVKRVNKAKTLFPSLGTLTEDFFNSGEATLAGLRRWLEAGGVAGTELDKALNQVKCNVIEGLKRNEISDEAEKLVRFVLDYDFNAN